MNSLAALYAIGVAWVPAPAAFAQELARADSAGCAAALNAPSSDSAIVNLYLHVLPFDRTRTVPDRYRELLGAGLRDEFVVPRPLAIDSYELRDGLTGRLSSIHQASVSLRAMYRVTLHRDGHLSDARVVGGVRNAAFDRAVIRSFVMLDSSKILFLAFIAPLYRVEAMVEGFPSNRRPKYPERMLSVGAPGVVTLEFLVRADGSVDPESFYSPRASSLEFLQAAVDAAKEWRFYPMKVAGCSVSTLVQFPLVFARGH